MFKQIIKQLEEKHIIEILAFGYETIEHQIDFFGQKPILNWDSFFVNVSLDKHFGKYFYDKQDERRNLRNIAKKYGQLKTD